MRWRTFWTGSFIYLTTTASPNIIIATRLTYQSSPCKFISNLIHESCMTSSVTIKKYINFQTVHKNKYLQLYKSWQASQNFQTWCVPSSTLGLSFVQRNFEINYSITLTFISCSDAPKIKSVRSFSSSSFMGYLALHFHLREKKTRIFFCFKMKIFFKQSYKKLFTAGQKEKV